MTLSSVVWNDLKTVREKTPLVHNITNYVVMNWTANGLLALGAAPVMAHAEEELDDIVNISSALVINIGTLSSAWITSMRKAMAAANNKRIPIVLDPVGAGASALRTQIAREFAFEFRPNVIRGNASEIACIAGQSISTRGVDSSAQSLEVISAAESLAQRLNTVVCMSGETDVISDGRKTYLLNNGHPMMTRVTGTGCLCTAVVGAFVGVVADPLQATSSAMAVMGICGELAAEQSTGPGSFAVQFLDALANLNEQMIQQRLKLQSR